VKYFARKVGFFLATLWAVVTLNFIIPRLQPGDPAEIMVRRLARKDNALDPAQVQAMRAMLGTPDGSLWEQYTSYVGDLLHGDFGLSYTYYPFPVSEVIGQAIWWTVVLVVVTQVLAFVIGIVLGTYAAWRRNTRVDSVVTLGSTFLGTLQPFWIALLLLYVFGYTLGVLPTSGGYSAATPGFNGAFISEAFTHSLLPALSLLIVAPVGWVLGMRNTMIMNLGEDYIRLAKAKGLPERRSRRPRACPSGASRCATPPATRCCRASPGSPWRWAACSAARSSSRPSSTTRDWAGSWVRPSAPRTTPCCRR
jgi:peptide/nickel transport system permease protein